MVAKSFSVALMMNTTELGELGITGHTLVNI